MTEFTRAAICPGGNGSNAAIAGFNLVTISSADTNGALGAMELVVPRGEGQPRHVHALEDEFLHVLKGRFGFWCGDEYVELEQGGCIALPRDVPHQFRNVGSTTGKLLVVVTPGGFENLLPTVTRRSVTGCADIAAIAAEFGVTYLPSA
jgi:mannose-6-phosphate isomerase-like protein (cupin superfamily)